MRGFGRAIEVGELFQGRRPSSGPSQAVQSQLVHPSEAGRRHSVQSRDLVMDWGGVTKLRSFGITSSLNAEEAFSTHTQ